MKTILTILLCFISVLSYGRSFELSLNSGVQFTSRLGKVHSDGAGMGYSGALQLRYVFTKHWYTGIALGAGKLQHLYELNYLNGGTEKTTKATFISGDPSIYAAAQLGYGFHMRRSALNAGIEAGYVVNHVPSTTNLDGTYYYKTSRGSRYGFNINYQYRIALKWSVGVYASLMFHRLNGDLAYARTHYTLMSESFGASVHYKL